MPQMIGPRNDNLGVSERLTPYLADCQLVHGLYYSRLMKSDREIEILFRRLRLYDRLEHDVFIRKHTLSF